MEEQLWKMRVSHDIDFLITVETNTDPEIWGHQIWGILHQQIVLSSQYQTLNIQAWNIHKSTHKTSRHINVSKIF
jgi:hypothetical protein